MSVPESVKDEPSRGKVGLAILLREIVVPNVTVFATPVLNKLPLIGELSSDIL